jgi:hypothetical protein
VVIKCKRESEPAESECECQCASATRGKGACHCRVMYGARTMLILLRANRPCISRRPNATQFHRHPKRRLAKGQTKKKKKKKRRQTKNAKKRQQDTGGARAEPRKERNTLPRTKKCQRTMRLEPTTSRLHTRGASPSRTNPAGRGSRNPQ